MLEEKMKKHIVTVAVTMLAGSALAAAQQPTGPIQMQNESGMPCMTAMHGMMMGQGMPGEMMPPGQAHKDGHGQMQGTNDSSRRGMMSDSSHMAEMKSQLNLTDAQLQQLHTIVEHACTAAQPHLTMAMQAHQAAIKGLNRDNPNLDQFEDRLESAAKHMVAAQVEMAKGMIEVRKALTPAQRQKLDQMHEQMMQRRTRAG